MKKLLVLNVSGRVTRSITRRLTQCFAESLRARNPGVAILQRDVGQNPPPAVTEPWIAAAFTDPAARTAAMHEVLRWSEMLIDELESADTILLGTPIYNFGLPAALKAYFDQVIRVGRTFEFNPGGAEPYRPLLTSKPVIVAVSAGDSAMHPGGALAHLNFLEPHLQTLLGFIGLTDVTFVRVGDEEHGGDGFKRSLAAAESRLESLAHELSTGRAKFNEAPTNAPSAPKGLPAGSKGPRVKLGATNRAVTDGPFAETKELMAGI